MSTHRMSVQRESDSRRYVETRNIWWAALAAIVAAVVANVLVLFALGAVLSLPADFPPLQASAIAVLTAVGVAAGAVVFAIVSMVARQPLRTFRLIVIVALVVSVIPNLVLMARPDSMPLPGGSTLAFGVLIIFHLVAAAVSVYLLITLTRK